MISKYWEGFKEKIITFLSVQIFGQHFLFPKIPTQLNSVCELSHVKEFAMDPFPLRVNLVLAFPPRNDRRTSREKLEAANLRMHV